MGRHTRVAPPPQLRTSERTTYKRCRQQWHWAYNDRIRPKTAAPALRFGTLIHQALEVRYPVGIKRGEHPANTFEKLYVEELKTQQSFGFKDEDGTWHGALELGISMMNEYVREYGTDDEWRVIASECPFQVPVLGSKGQLLFTYVGTLDGIWQHRRTKQIIMVDYKTCKAISVGHLPLDEQAGSYHTFAPEWMVKQGILKKNQLPTHIMYTFLRKAMPDKRPRNAQGHYLNQDGSVSKQQGSALLHRETVLRDAADKENLYNRVKQEAREHKLVRRGLLDVYKNPGPFTCSGCPFRDMCELHETGSDWESLRDLEMESWDPYSAHEIESERN